MFFRRTDSGRHCRQELRPLDGVLASIEMASRHLNLWMHTLVELWSWNRPHDKLCDRRPSPWDDADRRPSHADRRKALRRQIMERELSTLAAVRRLPRKILQLTKRLMTLAV